MNHNQQTRNQQILDYVKAYTKDNGYEPEMTTISKDLDILRKYVYDSFDDLKQSGDIEELKPCRSKQYRLSTGS